jgi:putative spermidine/putrescine transport system permease protein
MHHTAAARWTLRLATAAVLLFLYLPLAIVVILSFNTSKSLAWPPDGFTLHWWSEAAHNTGARHALVTSLKVATGATLLALVLGTLTSLAVQRHRFFGREAVSFLVVLPIALPGIVTGIALNSAFRQVGIELGLFTLIVAHATFCIVVVYNNTLARLRRLSPHLEEASADLGADPWQTFRLVTFPSVRTALAAGGLLAFALSFDEIIVTNFTIGAGEETLPIWIFTNLFRPNQLPIVNAVAVLVVLISIVPVYLAHRLTREEGGAAAARGGGEPVVAEATAVP